MALSVDGLEGRRSMTVLHCSTLFVDWYPCTYKIPLQFADIARRFETVLCDRTRAAREPHMEVSR